MKYPQDLTGMKFNMLTVMRRAPDKYNRKGYPQKMWLCICDCGNEVIVRHYALLSGGTKSCGCYSKQRHLKQNGLSHHPLYRKWQGMIRRCEKPNSHAYENYGGRGIRVCKEWRDNYLAFYEWAINTGYAKGNGLSLERIDNDGDYSPDNCRWATYREQQNNKRRSRFVTYNGKTLTVAQWERETGIKRYTIIGRLNRGWSAERVLTTPVK